MKGMLLVFACILLSVLVTAFSKIYSLPKVIPLTVVEIDRTIIQFTLLAASQVLLEKLYQDKGVQRSMVLVVSFFRIFETIAHTTI